MRLHWTRPVREPAVPLDEVIAEAQALVAQLRATAAKTAALAELVRDETSAAGDGDERPEPAEH